MRPTLKSSAATWKSPRRPSSTSPTQATTCSTATTVLTTRGTGHIRLSTCPTTATSSMLSTSRSSPTSPSSAQAVWILSRPRRRLLPAVSTQLPSHVRTSLTMSGSTRSRKAARTISSPASAATTAASTSQSTRGLPTSRSWTTPCTLPAAR